jgi:hypothetical protein
MASRAADTVCSSTRPWSRPPSVPATWPPNRTSILSPGATLSQASLHFLYGAEQVLCAEGFRPLDQGKHNSTRGPVRYFGSVSARAAARSPHRSAADRAGRVPVGGQGPPEHTPLRSPPREHLQAITWPVVVSHGAADPHTPEAPLRANGLISALRTSSYCLVTREQSAARASIISTCHPILPGRAVAGLLSHADGAP